MNLHSALHAISRPAIAITCNGRHGWQKSYFPDAHFLGFKGHFPQHPVVPAVVQVLMAEETIAEATGQPQSLQALLHAKFMHPIRPDDHVICHIFPLEKHLWQCQLSVDDAVVASFRWQGQESL